VKYFQAFAAEEEALAQTEVTIAEFQRLLEQLWPAPEDR